MDRRTFLRVAAASMVGMTAWKSGAAHAAYGQPRLLWASRDGEALRLDITTPQGYEGVRYLLRDVRAGVMGYPHLDLVQRLAWMQAWFALTGELRVVRITSGLRTPKTNRSTEGAAMGSAHLPNHENVFFAADWDMAGISAPKISQVSKELAAYTGTGGTGVYLVRDFVHTDVLRQRSWTGR